MKLDDTTKIVSIVSAAVGVMIAIAGYFMNAKLQAVQESLSKLNVSDKQMDVAKKEYDLSARLTTSFSLPLARSFALLYAPDETEGQPEHPEGHISMASSALADEFAQVIAGWRSRKGLMTGGACQAEGLKARQVVTLVIRNIGHSDAVNVVIHAKQKRSPTTDPHAPWKAVSASGATLGYYDLLSAKDKWEDVDVPLVTLHGLDAPAANQTAEQVVLASVSGTTSLYGTILVPVAISWTDNISKRAQTEEVLSAHAAELRADLLGAEIGSVGSACH